MISETLSKLLLLWVATLMGLNSYSQKALANSVITQELLQHYVQALSHDSMQGRYTGTIGCEKSADLIATEMRKIELKLIKNGDSNYRHPYYIAKGKDTIMAANIIGLIPGKTPEKYIIFSAHYDHVGDAGEQVIWQQLKTTIGDKIYNGANDNASGVAALLALAT